MLAAGATACDADDITDVNENPNSPTNAPAGAVFTNATPTASAACSAAAYNCRGAELVAQHLAEVQYPDEDQLPAPHASSTLGLLRRAVHRASSRTCSRSSKRREATSAARSTARRWRSQSWVFEYLTDTFGDIPYSEALKGDSARRQLLPKYDAQKDVYDGLSRAHQAADGRWARRARVTLGGADPIYAGSRREWQKLRQLAARAARAPPDQRRPGHGGAGAHGGAGGAGRRVHARTPTTR